MPLINSGSGYASRKSFLGSQLLVVLINAVMSGAVLSDYDPAPFLAWVDETKTAIEIPGVAVAIVSREEVLHLETWGQRTVDKSPLVTSNSVFRIASMSKTFAGAAATLLVDSNQRSWDSRLSRSSLR